MGSNIEHYKEAVQKLNKELNGTPSYDLLAKYFSIAFYILKDCPTEYEYACSVSSFAKNWADRQWKYVNDQMYDLYYRCLLLEAPYKFDSYMLYLEKDREYKDMFYLPRRNCFQKLGIIQHLQDLEDDKLDILSISLPPGTGKTTLEKFFTSWVIGRHPSDYSLFYSHSGDITRMFYDGVLDITTSDEYKWGEIFPEVKMTGTNAKLETINFNKYKPFPNLQCTSVGSKNAGKVRCNRYLFCDDLIGGIEEAMNKVQLDKLWGVYAVDGRQRKLDGCKEIHIATRWSVHDVIGRLERAYENSERARFIAYPDIDDKTGESNFAYDINGLSVQFFHDQEMLMDDISYRCLYKNQPIEREGLLYHDDDLRRYLSLPLQEPDAIIGICDTKNKGTDYLVLPCMYQYGDDFYMVDCICDNGADYGVQYERIAKLIIDHNMQQVQFESNNGGDRVSFEVNKIVQDRGGRCNITNKATETNKETKIIVNADWVKKHVLFKDKSMYSSKDDYGVFMSQMMSYSVAGKNPHDDVCDALAMFSLFVNAMFRRRSVQIVEGFF